MSSSSKGINGHSIANLVILLVANLFVVYPAKVPIPSIIFRFVSHALSALRVSSVPSDLKKRRRFTVGLVVAPLSGVLVLLASNSIDGATVKQGVVGQKEGLQPYDISEFEPPPPLTTCPRC